MKLAAIAAIVGLIASVAVTLAGLLGDSILSFFGVRSSDWLDYGCKGQTNFLRDTAEFNYRPGQFGEKRMALDALLANSDNEQLRGYVGQVMQSEWNHQVLRYITHVLHRSPAVAGVLFADREVPSGYWSPVRIVPSNASLYLPAMEIGTKDHCILQRTAAFGWPMRCWIVRDEPLFGPGVFLTSIQEQVEDFRVHWAWRGTNISGSKRGFRRDHILYAAAFMNWLILTVMAASAWLVFQFIGQQAWRTIRWRRAQRRMKKSQCASCGYPFAGRATDICPECGKTPESAMKSRPIMVHR